MCTELISLGLLYMLCLNIYCLCDLLYVHVDVCNSFFFINYNIIKDLNTYHNNLYNVSEYKSWCSDPH